MVIHILSRHSLLFDSPQEERTPWDTLEEPDASTKALALADVYS